MSRDLIAEHLKKAMGLHAPTVGMMTVSSAIDKRMRACQINDDTQYLNTIISDKAEMKQLIEAVLIPETWFFRESQPYEYILRYLRNNQYRKVNILSIPCSSGEEPYSIAMMLMDNNISVDAFRIDAVDIGENNIAKAKRARYRKNSFRSDDLSFMDRYFHEEDNLYNLSGFVKNQVRFYCNNVLSESFDLGEERYDIILCRNLLIYFDPETQFKMFATINRMLKAKGILILGHAESNQCDKGLFVPAVDSKSYVYVKHSNHEQSLPYLQKIRKQNFSSPGKYKKTVNKTERPFANVKKVVVNDKDIDLAFKLADEGKIDASLEICNELISNHTDTAKAYYLLGIIYDTKGDTSRSYEALHKAIYLDPHNAKALMHLSLIAEQRGDQEESIHLRQRAQRVQERHSA